MALQVASRGLVQFSVRRLSIPLNWQAENLDLTPSSRKGLPELRYRLFRPTCIPL